LNVAQIGGLSATQLGALTTTQVAALNAGQIDVLTTTQIGGLTSTQIGTLNSTQLAELTTTPGTAIGDDDLRDEVRQLVLARNERRARQGLQRLDVDAEVTRTLDELAP